MHQIYDWKRLARSAYATSNYQAYLLLQTININRGERLSDSCLEYLAYHIAASWETADKAAELFGLMKQLLHTTAVDNGILEHALDHLCNEQDTPNAISTVCPSLTLLIAISYIDRLNQNFANFKGTSGCAYRLVAVAYMVAAKYMRANLKIIQPSINSSSERAIQAEKIAASNSPLSRLEVEFLHFLGYNLVVQEPQQLIWWAKTWDHAAIDMCAPPYSQAGCPAESFDNDYEEFLDGYGQY